MNKSAKVKKAFLLSEMENLASTSHHDIVCVLSKPSPVAHTVRLDFQAFIDLMRTWMSLVLKISLYFCIVRWNVVFLLFCV